NHLFRNRRRCLAVGLSWFWICAFPEGHERQTMLHDKSAGIRKAPVAASHLISELCPAGLISQLGLFRKRDDNPRHPRLLEQLQEFSAPILCRKRRALGVDFRREWERAPDRKAHLKSNVHHNSVGSFREVGKHLDRRILVPAFDQAEDLAKGFLNIAERAWR